MYLIRNLSIGLTILLTNIHFCSANMEMVRTSDWPEMPFPENSSLVIVSENMIFNGLPMKTWELKALMSPKELLRFYENVWAEPAEKTSQDIPGHLTKRIPNYTVISRAENKFLLTVQIEDKKSSSSNAYLSISKILDGSKKNYVIGNGFPAPAGTVFINDIKALDGNKKSRTIIAASDDPLQSIARFYQSTMRKSGWVELTRHITMTKKGGAMTFQRNKEELNITLSPGKNVVNIVAVLVEN